MPHKGVIPVGVAQLLSDPGAWHDLMHCGEKREKHQQDETTLFGRHLAKSASSRVARTTASVLATWLLKDFSSRVHLTTEGPDGRGHRGRSPRRWTRIPVAPRNRHPQYSASGDLRALGNPPYLVTCEVPCSCNSSTKTNLRHSSATCTGAPA